MNDGVASVSVTDGLPAIQRATIPCVFYKVCTALCVHVIENLLLL